MNETLIAVITGLAVNWAITQTHKDEIKILRERSHLHANWLHELVTKGQYIEEDIDDLKRKCENLSRERPRNHR